MGAVLDPAIFGLEKTRHLPNASTFCGRCESVCPMMIPLPKLMRHWRDREFERALQPATQRWGIKFWAFFAARPALYRLATRIAMRALGNLGSESGRFKKLPLAGGWTQHRDMPAPEGRTFMDQYRARSLGNPPHERARRGPRKGAPGAWRVRHRTGAPSRGGSAPPCAKPNLIPARGQLEPAARVELFCLMAEKVAAAVRRLAGPDDVPHAVADHLRQHNLPMRIRTGADPAIEGLPWERVPQLDRLVGPSDGSDPVALSRAFGGVAETGTLVLLSGPENPTTLNFLPDTHIVMIAAADIVGDYESIWRRLRELHGPGSMPRTVNMITGPSRSADIEQTLILGAHGPRALLILVLGEAEGSAR
jgi:hypothetical protein